MVSKEFIQKLNTIINTKGQLSEEEVIYIGESLIQFYKTIEKIIHGNEDGQSNTDGEKEI